MLFHPARKDESSWRLRPQPLMVAVAVLAAIPLVIYALDQGAVQRACPPAGDQHCEEFHFAGMAALALALPLTGLAASLRAQGWQIVTRLVGAAAVVFGLSGILLPDHLSSVGETWGSVALVVGLLFVAVAELGSRRSGELPPAVPRDAS